MTIWKLKHHHHQPYLSRNLQFSIAANFFEQPDVRNKAKKFTWYQLGRNKSAEVVKTETLRYSRIFEGTV